MTIEILEEISSVEFVGSETIEIIEEISTVEVVNNGTVETIEIIEETTTLEFISSETIEIIQDTETEVIELGGVVLNVNSGGADSEFSEELSGTINNLNMLFYTSRVFRPGTTKIYYNGQRIFRGTDYGEIGNNQILFTEPPLNIGMIDHLYIEYKEGI